MHFSEQRENIMSFWKVKGSKVLGFLKFEGGILSSRQTPVDILPVLLKTLILLVILKINK